MIGNNEILNYLLIKEDFLPEPTDLGDGKITIGSGLTDSKWLDLYKKRGNKWSKEDNRKAVLEEIQKRRLWAEQNVPHWNSLPESSQDALLSYRYNYNFTPKNSPKLFKALEDKNYLEAAKQIDATSKNPDFKNGLLKRRKEEQQWFLSGFPELSKPNGFAIPYKYPVSEYPTAAEAYRKSMTPITGNYSQGGQLQNHKQWKDLSYSEKNDIIKVAVRNGITTLPEIRQKYNEFADEGNLYAGGGYVYDMLPQLFASDGVQVRVTSGYRPNSKVQGSEKPSRHSMHEAADIVGDFSAIRRVLDNPESNTAKWMRANGYGYLDETSKTGTKKFWHDQKGDHSHYHIGKDSGIAEKFAASTGSTSNTIPIVSSGNYLDIAKAHIRNNEGWSPMPVADGPKNTGWRSVGYGFNDSGFKAKYPQGISKAYENGITKAQAEQELDYILGNMDSHLRRVYGNKWNSFNDNQKAAILDTYYQRPASVVGRNSAFYNAVMRGDNNAVNYLGVAGYNTRNNDRRKLFNSAATQMPEAAQTVQQPLFYQPWNPQAANLYTSYSSLAPYPAPIFSPEEQEEYFAKQIAQAQKQQEVEQREKQRQEKADRINRFSLLMNLTDPYSSDSSSSSSTPFADAVSMLTQRSPIQYFSNGGSIFIKPENRGKFTRLKERTGHSASWFKENGTPAQKKMAIFALNSRHWKHGLGGNLFKDGGDTKADIPVTFLTQSEAMPLLANNPNRTAVLDEVTVKPYRKIPQQYNNGITNQAANEKADEFTNRISLTPDIDIRQRLYDNVVPFGYNNPVERIASAILLNKPSDKQEYAGNRDVLDDLWGTYLGIPKDRRHYNPVLKTSKYKPTNSKDSNQDYVSIPFTNDDIDYILKEALWQGEKSQALNPELGTFTVDTGRDKKGQYVSYYDKWDLNPFRGITNVGNKFTNFIGLDKAGDLSFGIGKPIEIYDRIYLDDYYNIPHPYRGATYLPEVTVTGKRRKKRALGGNLFKDGGDSKSGIPVTYFTQNEAMSLLADNPNRTAVLDEVTVRPYNKLPMQSELFQGITNQAANEKADELTNKLIGNGEAFTPWGISGLLFNEGMGAVASTLPESAQEVLAKGRYMSPSYWVDRGTGLSDRQLMGGEGKLFGTGTGTIFDLLTTKSIGKGVDVAATKTANAISKIKQFNRLEKTYTGVPHKELREAPGTYMDEVFPNNHIQHTIWSTDDIDYPRSFDGPDRTIYDIYIDPKELSILETPSVPEDKMLYWQGLPYKLANGKVSFADNLSLERAWIPRSKDISLKKGGINGNYTPDEVASYIMKDGENGLKILDWKKAPGTISTDDVVKYSLDNGYDATRFNRVFDGTSEINGILYDYPINELVLNPNAPRYVLPHGTSKMRLWNQLPTRYSQSNYFASLFPYTTLFKNYTSNE